MALLGCLLLSGAHAGKPAADEKGAHLRLEGTSWDFGDVPRRRDLVHEFRFVNDGTAPLVLLRVVTSCSCLKASFSKRPVAPADSGVIHRLRTPQERTRHLQQGDPDLFELGRRAGHPHRPGKLHRRRDAPARPGTEREKVKNK